MKSDREAGVEGETADLAVAGTLPASPLLSLTLNFSFLKFLIFGPSQVPKPSLQSEAGTVEPDWDSLNHVGTSAMMEVLVTVVLVTMMILY